MQWFSFWKFKNTSQIYNLIFTFLNSHCTGPCVFPWRREICYLLEWRFDVGKGESILTFRDWNTTQSILIEDFFPCWIFFFFLKKNSVGSYYLNLCCSSARGWEKDRRLGELGNNSEFIHSLQKIKYVYNLKEKQVPLL